MKKLTSFIILVVIISAITAYHLSGYILEKLSNKALGRFVDICAEHDVRVDRPLFKNVRLSSINGITWEGVSIDRIVIKKRGFKFDNGINSSLRINSLTISLKDIMRFALLIEASGIKVTNYKSASEVLKNDPNNADDTIDIKKLKMTLGPSLFQAKDFNSCIKAIYDEIVNFMATEKTLIPMEFSGASVFNIEGMPIETRFHTVRVYDETSVLTDKDDLKRIAQALGVSITDGEIDVLARHTLKLPQFFKIGCYAAMKAKMEYARSSRIPEQVLKNVLLSYLLTNAYGEALAREVADAYGKGMEAGRQEDLVSFVIGRRYALEGYPETSIPEHILSDPSLILYQ